MDEQILEAIRYFEAGNKQDAQKQLALALKTDPENEYAWLWMALTLEDDPVRKRACLEKVLALNPQNSKANQMLHSLKGHNGFVGKVAPVPQAAPAVAVSQPASEATLVEAPAFVAAPYSDDPIQWDESFEDDMEGMGEETAVFTNTIDPYDQVDELLEPNPDPREQLAESSTPPKRFNFRKLLIIVGVIIFASALYAVSVLLLVKDDLLGTPVAENITVTLIDPTATSEPTATTEPTAVPVIISEPTAVPTATTEPTATPEPTATATVEPTATETAVVEPTTTANTQTYLQTARDTAAPLQTALTQIIQLVAEVDFANEAWKSDLLAATEAINTAHNEIKLLTPPAEAQATHDQLLATSGECHAAATYLEEGTNNNDIEAMQPAAAHLTNCRDGLDDLTAVWNTLPIDVNTATPESGG
ncbi:MAG: hypothetical protein KC423_08940 [Anaerolineales bacterium]|nr:hypothetical protein [Anaerolineales bacterium]